ncbi:hypothetical protein L3X39_00230 [Sabulilitoribacter multivorans]|uniref:Glycerophosphoryl diester phosphodiesterase membrane domain-containing protein n=1 Tax=Flaviramulus multivorans TaxID=1304750 RepID=A0ABS9IE39_9FLAO|nr:hypothetical protein [Flaviramulus multivorans]MCF7559046.1 hypothetical protein [Flaviramulus multivorans]
MNTINNLLERIEQAKDLDFGDIFNKSIELFKKVWLQGLLMLLLTIAFMIPFYIIMYLPLIAMGILDPETLQQGGQPNMAIFIPFYLFMIVFSFFAVVITFGLKSAFYRICKLKDLNESGADDYFYFFKKPHLRKTIKLAAMTFGISLVATLLCVLPIIYVMVPIALINVIYAFNPDMSPSDIVKVGFKLGNKKWLITFGLIFVAGLLAQLVGIIMCFIGVFVTAAFAYLPVYFIYKEVVGFGEQTAIDQIGNTEE